MRSEGGSKEYESSAIFEGEQAEVSSASQNQTNTADPEEFHEESALKDQTDSSIANGDTSTTQDASTVTNLAEVKTVNATQPITNSLFKDGTTIYITRSDQFSSYRKFVTVDLSTQTCPSGYEPCSKLTSPANTLCVKPGAQNYNCPITDIKVIEKSRITEQLSPEEAQIYEQADFSGDDDELDWALFYSREYNGLPLVSFVLEQEKPCFSQEERTGDPQLDILDIGSTVYKQRCEDEYSGLVNERYRSVSEGLVFAEYEWFQDAGIWAAYETLPGKQEEVERLKQRKKETQLLLWAKPVPAFSLECRSGISDVNTFADLIQTELDFEEARLELLDDIEFHAMQVDSDFTVFWVSFAVSAAVILGELMCRFYFCPIKYKRYTDKQRQKIYNCYKKKKGNGQTMEGCAIVLMFMLNSLDLMSEIIRCVDEIHLASDPYFDRENRILKYAQCSDQYLELAVEEYLRPASVAPPIPEFGTRAIISIVAGSLIVPIYFLLACALHRLVEEQWALIDEDFPPGQANQNANLVDQVAPVPEKLRKPDLRDHPAVAALRARIAEIEAVQVARDEENMQLIEDGQDIRVPYQGASASSSFSPEMQSNNYGADGNEAKILNRKSIVQPEKNPQD